MANSELLILVGYVAGALLAGRLAYIYLFDRDVYKIGGINLVFLMVLWPLIAAVAAGVLVVGALVWLATWEPRNRKAERDA